MSWNRILKQHHLVQVEVPLRPGDEDLLQHGQICPYVQHNTGGYDAGGVTWPSLAIAPNTITDFDFFFFSSLAEHHQG